MLKFEITKHFEESITKGLFALYINLTEFLFINNENLTNDEIVEYFIHSRHLSYDCLADCVKKNPNEAYLKQLFNMDLISIMDFYNYDRKEIQKLMLNSINDPSWFNEKEQCWFGDKEAYTMLINKYLEIIESVVEADFYVINKDWFDEKDPKMVEPENWCYGHYFLVIWINNNTKTLSFMEFHDD